MKGKDDGGHQNVLLKAGTIRPEEDSEAARADISGPGRLREYRVGFINFNLQCLIVVTNFKEIVGETRIIFAFPPLSPYIEAFPMEHSLKIQASAGLTRRGDRGIVRAWLCKPFSQRATPVGLPMNTIPETEINGTNPLSWFAHSPALAGSIRKSQEGYPHDILFLQEQCSS